MLIEAQNHFQQCNQRNRFHKLGLESSENAVCVHYEAISWHMELSRCGWLKDQALLISPFWYSFSTMVFIKSLLLQIVAANQTEAPSRLSGTAKLHRKGKQALGALMARVRRTRLS